MSETNTDNLVENLLRSGKKGLPVTPDVQDADGNVWYTQNSYTCGTCPNEKLVKLFGKASKSRKGNPGKAEYVVDTHDFYIVIEDKDDAYDTMFSGYPNIKDYIGNGYDASRLYKCPIDDVLWYADHLKSEKDVVAIANFSDGTPENFQSASFFYPKDGDFNDLSIICSGGYSTALLRLNEYRKRIAVIKGETERTYEEVYDGLRKYAETSSRFLYKVGVDDADRLGLVSIVALALTNKKSLLYESVKNGEAIGADHIRKALIEDSDLSRRGVLLLNSLPTEKQRPLKDYIEKILINSDLTKPMKGTLDEWDNKDKSKEQYFSKGGNTILSRVTYSIYENIILTYDRYKDMGIDVMGTFYSLFLVYYASDKKKGIVLTPSHITKLFCDLAEYFSGKEITHETTILDICTGSGGFLIAALNYIDESIDKNLGLNDDQKNDLKELARKRCLIGAEKAPNMFMLAYANMNFHGDGSSKLYNLNSLLWREDNSEPTFGAELCKLYDPDEKIRKEEYQRFKGSISKIKGETEEAYESRIRNLVACEVFKKNGAEIGMINPPYGKDYNEFDFINAELRYLRRGGIGLAIVPISNQGASKNKDKKAVLDNHTLLASILMPPQLFVNVRNSGASVGTCILVFKAHVPHSEFLASGGKTFLADWREDGFKMVNKRGRFEDRNKWYAPGVGYHDVYIDDMKKCINNDYEKLKILNDAYERAFPDEHKNNADMIPSSAFKKDIHDGGIKSLAVKIFDDPQIEIRQKKDKKGNPKWKMRTSKGKKVYVLDEKKNKIPETESVIVWKNIDWSILDYVKTDYHELTNDDFIRSLRNYKLHQYMADNNMFFSNTFEEQNED